MVLSIARDLTQRRTAEAAFHESQHRFREMLENIPLLAVILDAEGRVQFANKLLLQLAGWTGEEVIGKDWFGFFVAPDQSRQANLVFDCIIQSLPVPFCENEIVTRSGKRRLIAWSNTVLKDGAGGIVGTASIGEDITERKRAEERLNQVNAFLLNLGYDYDRNMQALVELCGSLLEADCALYSRLEGSRLCVKGRWQAPPGMPAEDAAQGHVCFEVIQGPPDRALVVRRLQETFYAKTDPMVDACGLQTYWGHPVRFGGSIRGSLCAVFTRDCEPTRDDLRILGILAAAIGQDEARRQAEDDLRKSEQLYRVMASQMADVLWKFDVETRRFLYISPSVQRLRGYTVEEAMAQSLEQMLTEESLALVNRMLETRLKAFQAGDPAALTQVHEVQVIRKEDAPVWTEMATTLFVDERGRIGVIGVSRDITERKRAQETLRESETRLRTFYEAAFNGIVISEHGTIVDLNSRVAELLGYEISELIGRKVVDLVAPDDRSLVQKHQAEGYELPYEHHALRKDGSVLAVETQARHCIYAGRPMRVTALRDITARLKMEHQLNQLLKQQQVILDTAPIGIALTKNHNIQWTNATHCAMFGYGPEEMRGVDTVAFYVRPEDFERMVRETSDKISQGLFCTAEVEFHRRNGSRFWSLLQGRAIDPKDLSAGIIWMLMDVTERRKTEFELLKMSRALEQSPVTILITDLAGNIEYVNEAFTQLTGYSREEALGKNPAHLEIRQDAPRGVQAPLGHRPGRTRLAGGASEQNQGGSCSGKSAVISPITDPGGQITHLLAVKEDITAAQTTGRAIASSAENGGDRPTGRGRGA